MAARSLRQKPRIARRIPSPLRGERVRERGPSARKASIMGLGRLLRAATSQPEFPDQALSGMVKAGVNILEDKLLIWHNPMANEEADRVLREVGLL
jgi:hypothetical protein